MASKKTKNEILKKGVPKNKVIITGIPVRDEFKKKYQKKNKKEVLIMGGGLGIIPAIYKLIDDLTEDESIKIRIIVGKNEDLLRKLKKKYPKLSIIGYTDELHKYMKEASLIVTKAGGITIFEAIFISIFISFLYSAIISIFP